MPRIINAEFLNQNSSRAYPFREDASRTDLNGNITIPNTFILDMSLTVPINSTSSTIDVYLSRLTVTPTVVSCIFSDGSANLITTVAIPTANYTNPTTVYIAGQTDQYFDTRGTIVFGDVAGLFDNVPVGDYTFDVAATAIETCLVRLVHTGIRSIRLNNNGVYSTNITRNITLKAGTNMRFTLDPDAGIVRFDAISGEGFTAPNVCKQQTGTVRTINGIAVENLQIVGDGKCVDIQASTGLLTIKDTCSTPCCGCTETAYLTSNIATLNAAAQRVNQLISNLSAKMSTFSVDLSNALATKKLQRTDFYLPEV